MARRRRREIDEVIEDGQSVRVPLVLMDSLQRSVFEHSRRLHTSGLALDTRNHQPGYVYPRVSSPDIVDARQRAMDARREMIERNSNAWKSPIRDAACPMCGHDPDDDDDVNGTEDARRPTSLADATAMRRQAYDAMVKRGEQAWRMGRDAAQPDQSSRPGELSSYLHPVSPEEFTRAFNRRSTGVSAGPGGDQPDKERAYRERVSALENAWRTPTGVANPSAATRVERQGEIWRGGR
jgi:hypothetical protein